MKTRERKSVIRIAAVAVAIVVVAVAAYLVGSHLENAAQTAIELQELAKREPVAVASSIVWDGKEYRARNNVFTVLVMGVDKTSASLDAVSGFRGHGQADFLMLYVIDRDDKAVRRLMVDRDTITQITTLSIFGDTSGTRMERASLAFSFGDGKERSAGFVRDAIKYAMPGINIDAYAALNLDAIPLVNDAVGGVTVTIEDDFTALDPEMAPGATVTLHGAQTELFVRTRMTIGVGTNESRMKRQRVFLNALSAVLSDKIHADVTFADSFFDIVATNLTTDMTRGRIINEIIWAQDYAVEPIEILPGKHEVDGEGFMAFYLDTAAAEQWALRTYYYPIE